MDSPERLYYPLHGHRTPEEYAGVAELFRYLTSRRGTVIL